MRREDRMEMGPQPPNFGSARSDYGDRAYGGRLNSQGLDRGWWDKTSDEVSSWLGDEEAWQRRQMDSKYNAMHRRNESGGDYPLGFYPVEAAYHPGNVYTQNWRGLRTSEMMNTDVVTLRPEDSV